MEKIHMDGTFNFRDIGGYPTGDGKHVKKGLLYRSDELSHLSDADVLRLQALNVHTIIDYRSEAERVNNEDRIIPDATIYHLDPKADVAAMASSDTLTPMSHHDYQNLTAEMAKTLMSEQNRQFVLADSSKSVYKKTLELLLEAKGAVVWHCKGGKDRTGYAALLILGLLGVEKQIIIEDYLLTNEFKKEKNEKRLEKLFHQTHNDDLVQAMSYLCEAYEEFILAAFEEIEKTSGSIENYIKNELGLNEDQIKNFKDLYLE